MRHAFESNEHRDRAPHPPFWYDVTRPESAAWAAKNRVNAVMNGPSARVKAVVDRYIKEWGTAHAGEPMTTKLGTTRHVHVADSDAVRLCVHIAYTS